MKKNLLLGIVSTICAAALYVIGSTNQNTADLILVAGCIYSFALMFIVTIIISIAGIIKSSKTENYLFSAMIISVTAVIQYAILYKATVNWPLYYSIPTALISGLLFIWLMDYVRKGLHSVSE